LLKIVTEFPRTVHLVDHFWVPLPDGTQLNARRWLPVDAETDPVPAILEASPYRLTDGGFRDWTLFPYWAGHGYAGVKVDLRGTGDSAGIILDEYTAQEQEDVCAAIAWIAAQPWCSGSVGMTGISWTGFNGLQVAARRPPALKAIVTLMSTDDRYVDDVHYKGGCVSGLDMFPWGASMLHYDALPPHPQVVGDEGWRERWNERLEANFNWAETWLAHQRRDDYWRQGSVCEDYAAIEAAVYAIGGWTDGYTNAVLRLMAGLPGPRKGLIGPWSHSWPNNSIPGPSIGFLQDTLRWWDHWLKGVDTGIMDEPMLRVWMEDFVEPAPVIEQHPGRWVAEEAWPSPRITSATWHLNAGTLDGAPAPETRIDHRSLLFTGIDAGAWCMEGSPGDWPLDQRAEDGRSVVWDSQPLAEPIAILGFPEVTLTVASDKPNALVCVRLCDVAPDGCSKLVTREILNLTHRHSHEFPEPLEPGRRTTVTVRLDSIAHVFPAGHRLRVAVSTNYWPWVWPSPEAVTLSVFTGGDCTLVLPARPPRPEDAQLAPFPEPEQSEPADFETLMPPGTGGRVMTWDVDTNTLEYEFRWVDGGRYLVRHERGDFETEDHLTYYYRITEGDPLSASSRLVAKSVLKRGDSLDVQIDTDCELRSDRENFYVTNTQHVLEHGAEVFARTSQRTIPRDLG
jgi:putative CocE/NonD family hydrolase